MRFGIVIGSLVMSTAIAVLVFRVLHVVTVAISTMAP